ncbi:MAG TPA: MerR family transcriptional regulator [Pseudomonadales bacterium]|nr:MerR family transcriptional regulator [Pseudomonadales bacterium]
MLKNNRQSEILPEIPTKRYFTIGEVSELCNVKSHVLRYWEQEFDTLAPVKRRGNRRYYQQQDVEMVRKIRHLLYEQGFTIQGARGQLLHEMKKSEQEVSVSQSPPLDKNLSKIIHQLEDMLAQLDA